MRAARLAASLVVGLALAVGLAPAAGAEGLVRAVGSVGMTVGDMDRSIAFYTAHLGFKLERSAAPAFASVSKGDLIVRLSGPGSSGARPMPDGRTQEPGGWNRIVVEVDDLARQIEVLRKAGVRFRNQMETGPGGKQIQIEDPDGNPVELFQPASG